LALDTTEIARRLIAIRSTPAEGNLEIAQYVAGLMADVGLDVDLRETTFLDLPQANVLGTVGPPGDHDLLVNVHLDTVPAGDHALWTRCPDGPFALAEDGEWCYGLGVADTKLGLIPVLQAIEALDLTKLRSRLTVVGSFAEEIGLAGAKHLAAKEPPQARYAIATEPTELEIVHAHKGLAAFEATLTASDLPDVALGDTLYRTVVPGRSAHSSTPHLGLNALGKALQTISHAHEPIVVCALRGGTALNVVPESAEILTARPLRGPSSTSEPVPANDAVPVGESLVPALADLAEVLHGIPMRWPGVEAFDPPRMTHNLAVAEIDERGARIRFEFRPVPGVERDDLLLAVEDAAEGIREWYPKVDVDVSCTRFTPPTVTPEDSALAAAMPASLAEAGLPEKFATKAGSTEASVYAGLGMEAVVFGPGRAVGNTHRPNERLRKRELGAGARFYEALFRRLLT